ncbi:site-2 protease family protein [Candidatus Woesebacteria bacterium]|nr:site-2 protease family protein [Candidatus Woesebacteria bacterium]
MFTILIFFIVLSILVIIHEAGHFIAAKLNGIKVEEFGFGLPPRVFGFHIGETLYSLNALPFGGFVKVLGEEEEELTGKKLSKEDLGRAFSRKRSWQKIMVLVAGVTCNFLLGWFIMSYLFTRGVPVPSEIVSVEEVVTNSPAEKAGLLKGDKIRSMQFNETVETIESTEELTAFAKAHGDEEITLTVQRGEGNISLSIIPRKNPPAGQGALGLVISNYEIKKYSITEAPLLGLTESVKMTKLIFTEFSKTLFRFVTFQKQEAEIAGPVGIARLTSAAARQGMDALLQMIGLLSLNLAVINILPFPALDGGRLALVLYEMISRRKVNPNIERKLNMAGFAFLLSLIALVTVNDIIKLIKGL